jgi:hypothetical protein
VRRVNAAPSSSVSVTRPGYQWRVPGKFAHSSGQHPTLERRRETDTQTAQLCREPRTGEGKPTLPRSSALPVPPFADEPLDRIDQHV